MPQRVALRLDVWSDIACPWCWLGKHHLELALRNLGLEDRVEVVFRSFELDPRHGATESARTVLQRRYGDLTRLEAGQRHLADAAALVGLRFDFVNQKLANTFDAHRVHHFARTRSRDAEVIERFMRADHAEGADLADHATLRRLAMEAGLDGAEVDAVLASDDFAEAVRADEAQAAAYGIRGVPFFVLDGRLGLSGAQPIEVFESFLRQGLAPEPKAY